MDTAYVDESMRLTGEQPMYLLGATVFANDPKDGVAKLLKQKSPGAPKMHWREMGRGAQAKSLRTVADTDAFTTVVIATPMIPRRQERARRKCVETLFPKLEAMGVHNVIMESRNTIQDARDIQMVDIMKSGGSLKSLALSHVRGELEPRLWYPDLVLGAYGDMLAEETLPNKWVNAWKDVEAKTTLLVVTP